MTCLGVFSIENLTSMYDVLRCVLDKELNEFLLELLPKCYLIAQVKKAHLM